ncbi:TIGR01458 family HAD-type hydrolase [Zoogloea sp.]|uniref:TIGR01458 family HAD-type hydrolase n=1 Tax=Zoogloea sp. TaxID=49181 RepID=UPI0035AF01BB
MPLPTAPRAVLIDLAGVLHIDDQAIPGAVDALKALRGLGLPLRFLTNTTRSPRRRIVASLNKMGFDIAPDEIQTAVLATRRLVEQRGLHPHYLVHPDIADEIGASHATPDAVVIGDAGPDFEYAALNTVFRLLMQGLPFIVMARNRYFMGQDGLTLDMGAFVSGLEYSSGRQAEVVGKPAAPFFHSALDELGVAPADAVLIGDDLADDIGGAQAAGIPGILVRTGKFRPSDEQHPTHRPAAVVDDFTAAVALLAAGL